MATSYSLWLCVFLSSFPFICGGPFKEHVAQVQSEKDNGLKSGEIAVNHQDSRFNNKPVKKSFNYGTGYGHYHHPDEDLETSQYLTDLEQFYNYWFGG